MGVFAPMGVLPHVTLYGSETQATIGSDNGLSPIRRQVIIWTNDDIVNWTLGNKLQWNFIQNSHIFSQENAFENDSGKWRPFCLGLNLLNPTIAQVPVK